MRKKVKIMNISSTLLVFVVVWYHAISPIAFTIIFFRTGKPYDCHTVSVVTLADIVEYMVWIHWAQSYNQNTTWPWWRHQMKYIPRYCPLWGESPGYRLMFSLICAQTNGWIINRSTGDLIHHRAHQDVTVITKRNRVLRYTQRSLGIFTSQWRHKKWARWRLKSSASRLFTQPFIQAQIKENINSPRNWLLWGEFTSERWISRTKGQYRGKCFHLMMSSSFCRFEHHLFTGIVNIHPLCVLQLRCLFMFWLSWGAINIS